MTGRKHPTPKAFAHHGGQAEQAAQRPRPKLQGGNNFGRLAGA